MLGTNEQRNTRILKYCDREVKVFLEYCKEILKKELKPEELVYLADMDSPWGLNFGGVTVYANEDFSEYEVGYEVYEPGSYWEPPFSDYCEYSKHKNLNNALWDVLKLWLQYDYRNWQESQYAEELVAELEEYEQEN